MPPIPTDGATHDRPELGDDSGYDEFLKSFTPPDAKKPSGEAAGKKDDEPDHEETEVDEEDGESSSDEDTDETEEADEGEETEGEEAEAEAAKKFADEEGTYVKVKVGDKEHEVSVKDLKRLYGQETSLTQKSQKASEEIKKAETALNTNVAATNALLARARERFAPYEKIDFLLASQKLSTEEYTALRADAMKAHEDVQFLEGHLGSFMKQLETNQQNSLSERAKETLKVLAGDDPKTSIPGWGEPMYNELRAYATSTLGVPQDVMNNLVDAWGIRVLHKAMLYDKGLNKANVKITKVNKTPKKVVKTTTTPEASKAATKGANGALQRLKKSGSTDDAEAAFLERWKDE